MINLKAFNTLQAALSLMTVLLLTCGINVVRADVKGIAGTPDTNAALLKQVADLAFRVKQLEQGVTSLNLRINKTDVPDDDPKGNIDSGKSSKATDSGGTSDKGTSGKNSAAESGEGRLRDLFPVMTLRAPFVVVDSAGKPIFRVNDAHAKGATAGDRGIYIYGDSGVANFSLTNVYNGGKLLVQSDSGSRSITAGALGTEVGMMVRMDGKRKTFIGVASNGAPAISVLDAAEKFAAGLQLTDDGKGLVAVFNGSTPIAFLSQSSHAGGGNVTTADPGGNGVFSAGYDGTAGAACVTRKSGLNCLGIGLPLGGQ